MALTRQELAEQKRDGQFLAVSNHYLRHSLQLDKMIKYAHLAYQAGQEEALINLIFGYGQAKLNSQKKPWIRLGMASVHPHVRHFSYYAMAEHYLTLKPERQSLIISLLHHALSIDCDRNRGQCLYHLNRLYEKNGFSQEALAYSIKYKQTLLFIFLLKSFPPAEMNNPSLCHLFLPVWSLTLPLVFQQAKRAYLDVLLAEYETTATYFHYYCVKDIRTMIWSYLR